MSVMRVLRENKDSVMAVLEAFVYDPLLNWRLMDGEWAVLGVWLGKHSDGVWCVVCELFNDWQWVYC